MKNKAIASVEAPYLKRKIPNIRSGDVLEIVVKIPEGGKERLQAFEGLVISYRSRGISTSVVLRKISHGEAVERKFLLYSPVIKTIKRKSQGVVRRAKLYYLREREGKSAKIEEKILPKAKKSAK